MLTGKALGFVMSRVYIVRGLFAVCRPALGAMGGPDLPVILPNQFNQPIGPIINPQNPMYHMAPCATIWSI